jgi:hypothetical protein
MYQKSIAELVEREVEGETVVLNPKTGEVHQLNAVASCIWRSMEQATDIDRLVEQLVDEFDVDQQTAARDVQRFLDDMLARNLVKQIISE